MRKGVVLGLLVLALAGVRAAEPETVTYTGRVVDTEGQPMAGARVSVQVSGYRPPPGQRPTSPPQPPTMTSGPLQAVTGADGRYEVKVPKLSGGWFYRVTAYGDQARWLGGGEVPDTDAATVTVGDVRMLRLDGKITGKVVDAKGKPVAGAAVFVPGYGGMPARTGDDGAFEVTRVPRGALRVIALSGRDDRGEARVEAGAPDVAIALEAKTSPEAPITPEQRAELLKLIELAYERVKGAGPSMGWVTVPQLMARFDRPRAWAMITGLGDHWLKDRAREDLLLNTARTDPAQAAKELEHLDEFTSGLQQICCAYLALFLARSDPATAETLYQRAQKAKNENGSPLNQSLLDTGLLAACLALKKHEDLAVREKLALASAKGAAGGWEYMAYETFGWYLGEWPDVAEELIAGIDKEPMLRLAELAYWGRLADTDPELAASQFHGRYPRQEEPVVTMGMPGAAPGAPGAGPVVGPVRVQDYRTSAFRCQMAQRIAARLAPKDPEAALALGAWRSQDGMRGDGLAAVVAFLPPAARNAGFDRLCDARFAPRMVRTMEGQLIMMGGPQPWGDLARLARHYLTEDVALAQRARDVLRGLTDYDGNTGFYLAWLRPNDAWLRMESGPGGYYGGGPPGWRSGVGYLAVDFGQALAQVREVMTSTADPLRRGGDMGLETLVAAAIWAGMTPAERRVAGPEDLRLRDIAEGFVDPIPW